MNERPWCPNCGLFSDKYEGHACPGYDTSEEMPLEDGEDMCRGR